MMVCRIVRKSGVAQGFTILDDVLNRKFCLHGTFLGNESLDLIGDISTPAGLQELFDQRIVEWVSDVSRLAVGVLFWPARHLQWLQVVHVLPVALAGTMSFLVEFFDRLQFRVLGFKDLNEELSHLVPVHKSILLPTIHHCSYLGSQVLHAMHIVFWQLKVSTSCEHFELLDKHPNVVATQTVEEWWRRYSSSSSSSPSISIVRVFVAIVIVPDVVIIVIERLRSSTVWILVSGSSLFPDSLTSVLWRWSCCRGCKSLLQQNKKLFRGPPCWCTGTSDGRVTAITLALEKKIR